MSSIVNQRESYFSLIVFLSVFTVQMQAQNLPELGFKGLRLGMTRAEVDSLVRDSKWSYLECNSGTTCYANNGPDTISSASAVLSSDPTEGKYQLYFDISNPNDSFVVIGCKTTEDYSHCESFNRVIVSYFDNRVFEITIFSAWFDNKQPYIANDFISMATLAIANKYGPPSDVWKSDDYSYIELNLFEDYQKYWIKRWRWPNLPIEDTLSTVIHREISIYASRRLGDRRRDSNFNHVIAIRLLDNDVNAKNDAAIQKKEQELKKQRENPIINTDF